MNQHPEIWESLSPCLLWFLNSYKSQCYIYDETFKVFLYFLKALHPSIRAFDRPLPPNTHTISWMLPKDLFHKGLLSFKNVTPGKHTHYTQTLFTRPTHQITRKLLCLSVFDPDDNGQDINVTFVSFDVSAILESFCWITHILKLFLNPVLLVWFNSFGSTFFAIWLI